MGNIHAKSNKKLSLDKDISVKSNASSASTQSILKNSSYTNLASLQYNQQEQLSERQTNEPSRWQKFTSIKTRPKSDVRITRKSISAKGRKGIRQLDENLDSEHYEKNMSQRQKNQYIRDIENELIHQDLHENIREFLASSELNNSPQKNVLNKVGNKILDLLSEDRYPKETERTDEDGDVIFNRMTKKPLMQYNSANYLSIPRYFYTTDGTWNTIAMHIQSNDKISSTSLDAEYPHTEDNIKSFLGELGKFVFSKTDEETKEQMLKYVDPEGSDAERYRHFVERKAYKTAYYQIESQEKEDKRVTQR